MAQSEDEILASLLRARSIASGAEGGGIRPASLDFGWLSELPQIYDINKAKATRERILGEGLADVNIDSAAYRAAKEAGASTDDLAKLRTGDFSDPATSERLASRLMRGNDFEGAMKLLDYAHKQRTLAEQNSWRPIYEKMLGGMRGNVVKEPGAPAEPAPVDPFAGRSIPTAPADSGVVWPGSPIPGPGPQSSLPGPGPEQALSPSDQLIAAAQGAPPPQIGPQLAQAGPGMPPPSAPQQAPLPSWAVGPGLTATPKTVPQLPPEAQQQRLIPPSGATGPQVKELNRVADKILELGILGRRADPGTARLWMERFKGLSEQIYRNDPESKDWVNFNAERALNGENPIGKSDYKLYMQRAPDINKEAHVKYGDIAKEATAARTYIDHAQVAQQLLNSPQTITGPQAESLSKQLSLVKGLQQTADFYGIPFPDVSKLTSPAAAIDAYVSTTKQMVLAGLGGSLQKGVSEGDRQFGNGLVENIASTKEGQRLINAVNVEFAKRRVELGKIANKYMNDRGIHANTPQMDKILQDYADTNPLFRDAAGNLTAAGQRIQRLIPGGIKSTVVGPNGTLYSVDPLTGQLLPAGGR